MKIVQMFAETYFLGLEKNQYVSVVEDAPLNSAEVHFPNDLHNFIVITFFPFTLCPFSFCLLALEVLFNRKVSF